MKKLLYFTLLMGGLFITQTSKAQISVNINIGSQPLWGPVGYDYARFYYIPEIDVYYNVASRKYTYFHGNRWVTKSKLPSRYRHVNLFSTYKVVINDNNPWRYHRDHRNSYARYASHRHQPVLRDARHDRPRHVVERRAPSRDIKHYKKMEKERNKHNKHHKNDRRR